MKDIINTLKWKWKTDKMDVIGGIVFFITMALFVWLGLYVISLG